MRRPVPTGLARVSGLRLARSQAIAANLVQQPRPLLRTLGVAKSLGIDLISEPDLLWLGDLALSLPTPIGWHFVERPALGWKARLIGKRAAAA